MNHDISAMLAMADRDRQKRRRIEAEVAFKTDWSGLRPSARAQRASQFAHQVLGMVRQYMPEVVWEKAWEDIAVTAYDVDVEIAQVPPERDKETAAALRAAEVSLGPIGKPTA